MTAETQLREFGRLICQSAAGNPMTREETCNAYRQVILNEQPELQQGAFLMAHITRGPTTEELSGAWEALDLYDTAKVRTNLSGPVCDIVGTGSDALKTVNSSTPAALIASACGLPVAKKGARLVTGVSGASDVLSLNQLLFFPSGTDVRDEAVGYHDFLFPYIRRIKAKVLEQGILALVGYARFQ